MTKRTRNSYLVMIFVMSQLSVALGAMCELGLIKIKWVFVLVPFWGPYAILIGAVVLTQAARIIFLPFNELEKDS